MYLRGPVRTFSSHWFPNLPNYLAQQSWPWSTPSNKSSFKFPQCPCTLYPLYWLPWPVRPPSQYFHASCFFYIMVGLGAGDSRINTSLEAIGTGRNCGWRFSGSLSTTSFRLVRFWSFPDPSFPSVSCAAVISSANRSTRFLSLSWYRFKFPYRRDGSIVAS